MSRRQLISLLALGALLALVVYLALRNPKPPFLPADDAHRAFDGAEACLTCHGPGGPSPQAQKHPVGRDCMRCHAFR